MIFNSKSILNYSRYFVININIDFNFEPAQFPPSVALLPSRAASAILVSTCFFFRNFFFLFLKIHLEYFTISHGNNVCLAYFNNTCTNQIQELVTANANTLWTKERLVMLCVFKNIFWLFFSGFNYKFNCQYLVRMKCSTLISSNILEDTLFQCIQNIIYIMKRPMLILKKWKKNLKVSDYPLCL